MKAPDTRQANRTMRVTTDDGKQWLTQMGDGIKVATLYDIRDELDRLYMLLDRWNFTTVQTLRAIEKHLRPKEKRSTRKKGRTANVKGKTKNRHR
jgi:hypothetical protein